MQARSLFSLVIPRRSSLCSHCEIKLEPGMPVFSSIEGQEEDVQRSDLCESCWKATSPEKAFWKTKVPKQKPTARDLFLSRDERALSWFRSLVAEKKQDELGKRYVLALYLVRRKKLLLRKEIQREGSLYHIYENPQSEEAFTIVIPELSVLEVSSLQQEIADYLRGKVDTETNSSSVPAGDEDEPEHRPEQV